MESKGFISCWWIALILMIPNAQSAPTNPGSIKNTQTNVSSSPIMNCDGNSDCIVNYRNYQHEIVGKKIAIRSVYLIPTYNFLKKLCPDSLKRCGDEYESAVFYLQVQSIWPEPFLLTASRVSVNGKKKFVRLGPFMAGSRVLSQQITSNTNPSEFMFRPGEVKTIALSQGIRMLGVLDFFDDEVLQDVIDTDFVPVMLFFTGRVELFNKYMQKRFGQDSSVKIDLFEKDYKPVLSTEILLGSGGDLFDKPDISKNAYKIKYDAFIGEVIYQKRGGREAFSYRYFEKKPDLNVHENIPLGEINK